MHKALLLTEQNEELKTLAQALGTISDRGLERARFLRKQLEQVSKDTKVQAQVVWDEIDALLDRLNLKTEDYTKDKYHFHFDENQQVLYLCTPEEHKNDMPDIIRRLFE